MPIEDVTKAFNALSGKLIGYNTLFAYADGNQPTVYSTTRLREAFDNLNAKFIQNWCSVVINATLDRLTLMGWDVEEKRFNDVLDGLWNQMHLMLDADEAHNGALITHESFIIAWKEGEQVDVYYNDPRMCHMFYSPERPKEKQFAAKWWSDGETTWHMTLYYPNTIEYYQAKSKNLPSSANAFKPAEMPSAPNPYGVVPVFHFRGKGELGISITSLQDAVNKLFADMMIAGEYGAFRQRWIISNSDTAALKNAPNEIWEIPAGDGIGQQTSVGQFDATPLDNYLNAIDKVANAIAIISRTPKHYFFNVGSNISGEALMAMEGPLNKKAQKYQENFGVTWQELGAFLLKLSGAGEVDPSDITPVWAPAESVQPMTEAQTLQTNVSAGVPLVTGLRWQGKSQGEIKKMMKDKEDEKKANAAIAPVLLAEARMRQDNSNANPMNEQQDEQDAQDGGEA